MRLDNVLYVPGFSHNLMSVKTATGKGATFVFGEESYVRAPNSSVKIPLNTENNLYTFKVTASHQFAAVNCVKADAEATPTWVKLLVYICSILASLKVSFDEMWSRKFYSAWTAIPFTAEPVTESAGRQSRCCCDVGRLGSSCVGARNNYSSIIQQGIGEAQRRSAGYPIVYGGQKKRLLNIHAHRRA